MLSTFCKVRCNTTFCKYPTKQFRNTILRASFHSSFLQSNQQQPQQQEQQQEQTIEQTQETPIIEPKEKKVRVLKQYTSPFGKTIQQIGQITAYFSKNVYALFFAAAVVLFTYIYNNAFFPTQENTKEEKQVMSERAVLDEIELKARGEKI